LDAELKRGQPVTTIGSPQGIQNTVAFGNISAFPIVEGNKVIQFTAPISHGSSGGVLFDDNGKVIGITTAVLSEGENIGFAVPVDNLIELYKQWDKKSYKTFSIPTQKPTNAPTPKPTKYPIPSPTPKSSTNDESDSWEGVWRTLMERNNGVSAYFTLEAEWKLQLNNTLRIRFEIANNPYGKPIEAFELYAYAEDVWGNRINGDEIYYWTTIKDLLPGEKIYSDYITIVNGIEIYQVVCGINKIKYSDGTIQRPAEKSGIAWAIK
ncbi:MAG: trypsin-like peptidase domain-containing protein, partial [Clostridia bacterium]|nr:trypsin-like peptidase domain-containing protein [Clostridia bacterium]